MQDSYDQVKDVFLRGGSINTLSLINPSKSLRLGVNLEPPNFYEILLVTLKSSLTHHFKRVRPKRFCSSIQKSCLRVVLLGP